EPGTAFPPSTRLVPALQRRLPFRPTGAQERAFAEIAADLAAPHRMRRHLQGDVGSGKTLVALLAALSVVEAGHQAALMAPTELLAEQHFETVGPLAAPLGVEPVLLTGAVKGKARKSALAGLAEGTIPLAVGTHALIQEGVAFARLGLAIVDEQHRFGVLQRAALQRRGAESVDVLVMSATPIPRTLAGLRLALVHGRMKAEEKDAVMRRFKAGEHQVLVSTTVIEVGIDVPNATAIVIEHAERFGLAQLHQLRGRVGRGRARGHCF